MKKVVAALVVLALVLSSRAALALHPVASLAEIAQTADLIFTGRVVSQVSRRAPGAATTVYTDVSFGDVRVIHASPRSVQQSAPAVILTYEGGSAGGLDVSVSDQPSFDDGARYLVAMLDDGATYLNPLVGGAQGLFEVVRDAMTGRDYVLTSGRRAVLGLGADGLVLGPRLAAVDGGQALPESESASLPDRFVTTPPAPKDPSRQTATIGISAVRQAGTRLPLTLADFSTLVVREALRKPLGARALSIGGTGSLYTNAEGTIQRRAIPLATPAAAAGGYAGADPFPAAPELLPGSGSPMGACGYHDLPLVMEQVPADWWSYPWINDRMWLWNQFMDVYRYRDSDGTFGFDNGQNEFVGWIDDATRWSVYGGHWGTAIAITTTRESSYAECCRMVESDIQWNPAYSWTDDFSVALGTPGVIFFQSVTLHELGHAWGDQRVKYKETYDYDSPSVMQGYYSDVVEDGADIHWVDAYLIRRHYASRTGIIARKDVGVESYYAAAGLHNATTDALSYRQGAPMDLRDVTVENVGTGAAADVQLRFFLSVDRTIDESDFPIGSFSWTSFPPESYTIGTFGGSVPWEIPPGKYFVGARVAINGLEADDLMGNNTTSFFTPVTVTPAPLAAPAGVAASDGAFADRIRVTWGAVPHANAYDVYRAASATGAKSIVGTTSGTIFDDVFVPGAKPYTYWVRAMNDFSMSGFSAADTGFLRPSIAVALPAAGSAASAGSARSTGATAGRSDRTSRSPSCAPIRRR